MADDSDDDFTEQDRIDAEWFGRVVVIPYRQSLVRQLLAGNDTQCFTTAQYKAAYEASQKRVFKHGPEEERIARELMWVYISPEKHLLSTGLVREVEPGIWVAM